jgi:hypothetical protein
VLRLLLVAAIITQTTDLLTFYPMLAAGGVELNPFVVWMYEQHPLMPAVAKAVLISYIAFLYYIGIRRRWLAVVLLLAFVVGVIGTISNL